MAYTPLDDTGRQAVIAEATRLGKEQGISPEQALYNYAKSQGIDNSGVDTIMGFGAGSTDAWLKKSQQPAPQGNSYTPPSKSKDGWVPAPYQAPQGNSYTPPAAGPVGGGQTANPYIGNPASDRSMTGPGYGQQPQQTPQTIAKPAQAPQAPQAPQSSNLGFSNPYMSAQADAITSQYTKALNEQVLPGIGQGATMAGGYGGSRQGIAQGQAINGMGQNLSNALAGMYGQNYQQDQNTATQRGGQLFQYGLGVGGLANQQRGQDQSYNLGIGGLANQQYGQDQSFYTQNRQLDQSGASLGANLYNQGTQGNLSQGQGTYGVGTQQQSAPWSVASNATNNTSPYTGTGVSNIQTQQGSSASNTLGGALAGAQIGNLGFGGWQQQKYNPYTGQPV